MTSENLRDTFAAAALTGLIVAMRDESMGEIFESAYGWADAMLRERERTNHDAAPAARAQVDAAGISRQGTGNTPVTEPMPAFASGIGSVTGVSYAENTAKRVNWPTNRDTTQPRNGAVDEPVAWAVVSDSKEEIDCEFVYPDEATAGDVALDSNGGIVPLYRHPQSTLTDAERQAVEWCVSRPQTHWQHGIYAATLRGLLERLK